MRRHRYQQMSAFKKAAVDPAGALSRVAAADSHLAEGGGP